MAAPDGPAGGDLTGSYPNPGVRLASSSDTRSVATNPGDYAFKVRLLQLKLCSAVDLDEQSSSAFCSLVGFRAWGTDDTGGRAHELAYANDGVWYRNGTTAAGWGAWSKMPTAAEAPSLVNMQGQLADRPAPGPKGTAYFCTVLSFPESGGLTFPADGSGLKFGDTDSDIYLSDGVKWVPIAKGLLSE